MQLGYAVMELRKKILGEIKFFVSCALQFTLFLIIGSLIRPHGSGLSGDYVKENLIYLIGIFVASIIVISIGRITLLADRD